MLVLVALGGNLTSRTGPPAATLSWAVGQIAEIADLSICGLSRWWRTPAHPAGSGPDYLNGALAARTGLAPEALLARLHAIEASAGRLREGARWQARPLDLDLLAAGDRVAPDPATQDHWRRLPPAEQSARTPPGLILPHPRLQDRGFVLAPLAEIAPGWRHPRTGLSVAAMLAALPSGALAGMAPLD